MPLNKDIHRKKMFDILLEIFSGNLSKKLAFKGGTACYFLYSLDRFSTDLDFDILGDFENIDEEIIEVLKKYGNIKKTGRNLTLSYSPRDINIKVDLSRNIWKNNAYELVNFFGVDMKVQDKSTIFTNKLVALTERNTNRDIYDVYFFLNNSFEINEKLVFERTGLSKIELLEKILIKLKSLPRNYKILDGLGEVLSEEKKKFVKNKLLQKLIFSLEFLVKYK